MRGKSYPLYVLILVLGMSNICIYLSKSSSNKVFAQDETVPQEKFLAKENDSPLTEEELVKRYTDIIDAEFPALNFTIEDGAANDIKTAVVNAARNFIKRNDFTAAAKKKADDEIKEFAAILKRISKDDGKIELNKNKLVLAPDPTPTASPEVSPVPTASPEVSPVPTASPEVSPVPTASPELSPVPTASPETTPAASIYVNSNFNFRPDKKAVNASIWRNYFVAPQDTDPANDEFQRRKIKKGTVAEAQKGICPIFLICK
jgi:hypothetical protein